MNRPPSDGARLKPIGLIGVPTGAGAFAPGQEMAPAALRDAGLLDRLEEAGCDVRDHGDRELWRWRPDRDEPLSENPGRNEGLSYADALRAVEALLESPRLAALTVTELNPAHAEGSESIERLARDIARALSGPCERPDNSAEGAFGP